MIFPRRSVLYTPGSNLKALTKTKSLAADSLIFDLEDSVAPTAKIEARKNTIQAINEGGYGHRELIIRVNALDTPWGKDDIVEVTRSKAHALLIPKVESKDIIDETLRILDQSKANPLLRLWCMMETPRGILRAEEIAHSSNRLDVLVMGTSDLTKELRARHRSDRLPMIPSFGLVLLAGRAAGVDVLDGVHLDLNNDQDYRESCLQGRDLGFDGKTLIHPKQIGTANQVFGPTEEEITWSKRIIEAHEKAAEKESGVTLVDGKLIENLHVNEAKRLIERANAIKVLTENN